MNIEVVVASMNQIDFSLISKMNLKTDAVIANQGSTVAFLTQSFNFNNSCKLITTNTRGVGLNRNIGLCFAKGDVLVFSDEDVVFYDDYDKSMTEAFESFPNADVIMFGIDFVKNNIMYKRRLPKKGKLSFFKSLKFGACSIAIKRSSLLKSHLSFSELFGGGCIYSHGEDSDFIIQCYKRKLKIYAYNKVICKTSKDSSTCFEGYDEKYFFDTGAFAKHSFGPLLRFFYINYIAFRIKETNLHFRKKKALLKTGCKAFDSLISYKSFVQNYDK